MFNSQATSNLLGQILLSEAYDIDYGIFDHTTSSSEDVLKLVAVHPVEDVDSGTLLSIYTERFVLLGVHEITGISLDNFWKLPRHRADQILDLCAERKEKEAQVAAAAAEEVEGLVQDHKT